MLIDMALNMLLNMLRLYMLFKTDLVKERCEENDEFMSETTVHEQDCVDELTDYLMGNIVGTFLIYIVGRIWFLINIRDWRNKLIDKQKMMKKVSIRKAIRDSNLSVE